MVSRSTPALKTIEPPNSFSSSATPLTIQCIGLLTGEIAFPSISVFRFVAVFQQVDHVDGSFRPRVGKTSELDGHPDIGCFSTFISIRLHSNFRRQFAPLHEVHHQLRQLRAGIFLHEMTRPANRDILRGGNPLQEYPLTAGRNGGLNR